MRGRIKTGRSNGCKREPQKCCKKRKERNLERRKMDGERERNKRSEARVFGLDRLATKRLLALPMRSSLLIGAK